MIFHKILQAAHSSPCLQVEGTVIYDVRYKSSSYTKLVAEDNFITKESLMVETGGRDCIEKQYTPPQLPCLRKIVFEWNEKAHFFLFRSSLCSSLLFQIFRAI